MADYEIPCTSWEQLYEPINGLRTFCGLSDGRAPLDDCIYSEAAVSRVKYAYDRGMHLASHAWSHGNLAEMDPPASKSILPQAFSSATDASPSIYAVHDEMYRIERE